MAVTRADSLVLGRHPLLWTSLLSMIAMTMFVVTSPLPVILDGYLHDDSFYYLKTAENLANGNGSSFDGINYTNGYQPGWFAVLSFLYAIGVSHDAMVRVAIAIQSLFYVTGMVVLAAAFVSAGVEAAAAAAAIGIVFCGLVPVLGWNLLESGLTFLATSSLLYVFVCRDVAPLTVGFVLAAAALARTDHLLFVPLAAFWLWWRSWKRRFNAWQAAAFILPLVVLVGGYLMINLLTAGHIMPVSGRVKDLASSNWNLQAMLARLWQLDIRQTWKIGLLVAVGLLIRAVVRRELSGIGVYALGALSICAYYQLNYIAAFNAAFWYYIPLYVLFGYSIAAGLHQLMVMLRPHRRWALAAIAAMLLMTLLMRARLVESYGHRPAGERAQAYRIALVLRAMLIDSSARAAAWDAGILGYYGGAVTNLDGLVNSADFFERYLSRRRVPDYIREHRFRYLLCYEPDTHPGGKAFDVMSDYREIYAADSWVILERKR